MATKQAARDQLSKALYDFANTGGPVEDVVDAIEELIESHQVERMTVDDLGYPDLEDDDG